LTIFVPAPPVVEAKSSGISFVKSIKRPAEAALPKSVSAPPEIPTGKSK